MDYAKGLRIARAISGLQQKDLADKAHLDSSYVSLIEMGKRKPSLKAVRALSEALNIPASLLTLLASEAEDLTLTDPAELQEVATALAKLLLPETFHKDEPKPKRKVRSKAKH
jgi:transcriptional regulator with XRE-family HTH domain